MSVLLEKYVYLFCSFFFKLYFSLINSYFFSSNKVCPSNSDCRNTPGSFICDCKPGFTLQSHIFYTCVDEDECLKPNICDHKCVNTYGSYQCTCNEGYKLASDRRTCQGKFP